MQMLGKKRYTTEFVYGGACCTDGIEDIAIEGVNAPTFVGEAIDRLKLYEDFNTLRPREEWHEGYGDCLFWRLPITEAPYCGSPLDTVWEERNYDNYFTHFTRLIQPIEEDINER